MARDLQSLVDRRIRGDLLQQHKIEKGHDVVNFFVKQQRMESTYINGPAGAVRGNRYRYGPEATKLNIRNNFYTNRVCNHWNALSNEVIESPTINSFKDKIDELLNRFRSTA